MAAFRVSDLLSPAQVAARLGIPEPTVRWHCREENGLLHDVAIAVPRGQTRWAYLIPQSAVEPFKTALSKLRTSRGGVPL